MKLKKRQKLCYNCEGEIDLDVIVCPFCAADLREEKPEQLRPAYNPFGAAAKGASGSQTSQSLYPSPYSAKPEAEPAPAEAAAIEEKIAQIPPAVGPIVLVTLGVQLFLLGVFLLLFSDKGTVLLKWDGRFWFFYILASAPPLYFGYRALLKME